MPRNPAGIYTLPNPPVVSGTTILSLDENTTRADLEAEMSNSLDRSGRGPMLAPIRTPDGNVAVPVYSFTGETNSGIYRAGPQDFWFTVGGANVLRFTASGIELAAGKFAAGLGEAVIIQDAEPTVPPPDKGETWYESDTAGFYLRYQNPDLTLTWVSLAPAGGDFLPFAMRGAPGGVAALDVTGRIPVAQVPLAVGSRVRGATGIYNAASPNTKFDLNAEEILLRDTSGNSVLRLAPGVLTNDIGLAGPIANGRDQAGAFSVSTWIHLYWIWNPTTSTIATLSSLSTTSPTLPAGYTYFAYACALRIFSTGNLLATYLRGSKCTFNQRQQVLSGGTSTAANTAINCAGGVPPNVLDASFSGQLTGSVNVSFEYDVAARLQNDTFSTTIDPRFAVRGGASFTPLFSFGSHMLPVVGQQILYQLVNTLGTGTLNLWVDSYRIPNGDS